VDDTGTFQSSPKEESYALIYEQTSSKAHTYTIIESSISTTADLIKKHGQSTKLHP
jgi:hypothetical protein